MPIVPDTSFAFHLPFTYLKPGVAATPTQQQGKQHWQADDEAGCKQTPYDQYQLFQGKLK